MTINRPISKETYQFSKKLQNYFDSVIKSDLFYFVLILLIGLISMYYGIKISLKVLEPIITSAAIIIGLVITYLIAAYFSIHQLRQEKLKRFVELQEQLRPYQRAFYAFGEQITRKYSNIDFLHPTPWKKLTLNTKFWEENPAAYAIIFVRSLYEVGRDEIFIRDFETEQKIISSEQLNLFNEMIGSAASTLGRHKHYKLVLKGLDLPEDKDLDLIKIVDSSFGLGIRAKAISNESENFQTLAFWDNKLNEALEILEKMKTIGGYIYYFQSPTIKETSTRLLILSLFGIIFPLIILSNTIQNHDFVTLLLNISFCGFLIFFLRTIYLIYKQITKSELTIVA